MIDPKVIWSSPNLPTLPSVAIELLDLSKNPESEINDFIRLIKTDPAITAKILKSTNSSYSGFKNQITSIDRAVPLLGTTVVTSLALSFSLSEAAMTTGPMTPHFQNYWMQSVVQAAACEVLAQEFHKGMESDFFLAGLLADLGRLAMLKTIPEEYLGVLEQLESSELPLHQLETEHLGVNHVEAGLRLMESWNLPGSLNLCMRHQHDPLEVIESAGEAHDLAMVRAVAVSSSVGEYFCAAQKGVALQRLQQLTAAFYGWSDADLEEQLEKMKSRIDQAGELFSIDTSELGNLTDIMSQASEQLALLAMRAHVASTQATVRQQMAEEETKALEVKNHELEQQTIRDVLTNVYNRKFFDESLDKELARAARNATTIGVVFLDIDHFKKLNDNYGHQFGDEVLRKISAKFENTLRKSDVLGRYGGEEFIALLSQPTAKGMHIIAERLREAAEQLELHFESTRVPVTISVGGCIAMPQRGDIGNLAGRLVAQADEAMYDSKRKGRNQVHIRSLIDPKQERITQLCNQKRFSRWLVRQGHASIQDVSKVLLECQFPHEQIGVLAQKFGYLKAEQVDQILETQKQTYERFGMVAISLDFLTEEQVAYLLAIQQEDSGQVAHALVDKGYLEGEVLFNLMKFYRQENEPGTMPNGQADSSLKS